MTAALRLAPWVAVITPILMWRTSSSVASLPLYAAAVLFGLMFAFGLRNARHHGVFAPWPASERELRQILRRGEPLIHQEMTDAVIQLLESRTAADAAEAESAEHVLDARDEEIIRSGVGIAVALGRLPGRVTFDEICELAPSGEVSDSTLRRLTGFEIEIS